MSAQDLPPIPREHVAPPSGCPLMSAMQVTFSSPVPWWHPWMASSSAATSSAVMGSLPERRTPSSPWGRPSARRGSACPCGHLLSEAPARASRGSAGDLPRRQPRAVLVPRASGAHGHLNLFLTGRGIVANFQKDSARDSKRSSSQKCCEPPLAQKQGDPLVI